MFQSFLLPITLFFLFLSCSQKEDLTTYNLYQQVQIDFVGPASSESDPVNPFTNFKLEVLFTSGDHRIVVPGFFAADGQASETSAKEGNIWRVNFSPSHTGIWTYEATLRKGKQAYLSNDEVLEVVKISDSKGSFKVVNASEDTDCLTSKGPLKYDGTRYLKWTESNKPYIKGGANSPENFLAYKDFDGTYGYDSTKQFLKTWTPHIKDWRVGDPTWQNGKGKGIIGALNYLAEQGMNAIYFITMNIEGDGCDVWPYASHDDYSRFDVSKLDQWDIVFRHAQKLGIVLQFVIQETENETLLDGGNTGPMRQLYFRELVARFGYHNGILWNLGEENGPVNWEPIGQNDQQRKDMCSWFDQNDPFDHPVLLHTHSWDKQRDSIINPLIGYELLDGLSVQINDPALVHDEFVRNYNRSKNAGHTWVQHMDEIGWYWQGAKPDIDDPEHDSMRVQVLWGNLMAGGAGAEWYFGYKHIESDLLCEDWRSRAELWKQTKAALDFFKALPVQKMEPSDDLVNEGNWCFSLNDELFVVYVPDTKIQATLDLTETSGKFSVSWYHPSTGQYISPAKSSDSTTLGGQTVTFETPSSIESLDWAILVEKIE